MRRRLAPFANRVITTVDPGTVVKWNWHIDLICEYLEALTFGELDERNLIINIAPRSLKSLIVSVAWPAWLLGLDPSERIITASGVASLATEHSVFTRQVMRQQWYKHTFPNTVLADDQDEKKRFRTTASGHRIAFSVGEKGTLGEGGRIKILDDPIDPNSTFSLKNIETTNRWLDLTWSSRSDDPARTKEVLVMQRLSVNDPTAHLLEQGGWHHLKVEQEARERHTITFPRSGKIITREEGDLMHPERMDAEAVRFAKRRLGSYGFDSQHQQEPTAFGGNRIKLDWFGRYGATPSQFDRIIQSWDTANKGKDVNNKSALVVLGEREGQWYLLDVVTGNYTYPDLKRVSGTQYAKWRPNVLLIEDKGSGQQLIQELKAETPYPVEGVEPEADKVMRMEFELPQLEAGVVSLPDPLKVDAPWLAEFEEQITQYPAATEWDSLDAFSQALKWIRTKGESSVELW